MLFDPRDINQDFFWANAGQDSAEECWPWRASIDRFGVCQGSVSLILRGKTWRGL